mmetsp:Transcript_14819/g.43565  ORF Transcript_14819/g.43565 Transcript_14819/m.43565 type:complete len:148 (-) Transcript_14819:353-796(-)
MDGSAKALCFCAAVATTIVGVVNAFLSFEGATASIGWSSGGFFDEVNAGFKEAFLITPEQIARHWQPLILGLIALGQHIRVAHVWKVYSNWAQAAIFYFLLAFFGNFGFAGNLGVLSACLCLVATFICIVMACYDRSSTGIGEPLIS